MRKRYYYDKATRAFSEREYEPESSAAPAVHTDTIIGGMKSEADGQYHTSKSAMRRAAHANGMADARDYSDSYVQKRWDDKQRARRSDVRSDVIEAIRKTLKA